MAHASSRIALFPGTFDPMTNGHLDVIRRAQGLFDELIVGIGHNPLKKELFRVDEREALIRQILEENHLDVTVETYRGLTVDFARSRGVTVMLRGLRNVSDLQAEFQLALTNRTVANMETVFLMTDQAYGFTSSSLIKQIASEGDMDRLAPLLPQRVIAEMKRKRSRLRDLVGDAHKQ